MISESFTALFLSSDARPGYLGFMTPARIRAFLELISVVDSIRSTISRSDPLGPDSAHRA
jgi:hypothetical protein